MSIIKSEYKKGKLKSGGSDKKVKDKDEESCS